jgi:hypothetical protein
MNTMPRLLARLVLFGDENSTESQAAKVQLFCLARVLIW